MQAFNKISCKKIETERSSITWMDTFTDYLMYPLLFLYAKDFMGRYCVFQKVSAIVKATDEKTQCGKKIAKNFTPYNGTQSW